MNRSLWRFSRSLAPLAAWGCCALVGCTEPPPVEQPDLGCRDDDGCPAPLACQAGTCVQPRCPDGASYVRGGTFTAGCQAGDSDCAVDAQPVHKVTLTSGLCLSDGELTVAAYRACLDSGACPLPAGGRATLSCSPDLATWSDSPGAADALPMSCLLWDEARLACVAAGGRLPTEAEWERAARGSDGRSFPWGRAAPVYCDQGLNYGGVDCPGRPWPAAPDGRAGAMLRGPYGTVDLAGNLSEWVADLYAADAYAACADGCSDPTGPTGPSGAELRVRRGGTFASRVPALRTYARDFHLPSGPRSDLVGVRCAFASLR